MRTTGCGRTLVAEGFDPVLWDRVDGGRAWQSGRWLTAMASRIPGRVYTAVHDGVGALVAVVSDADAYESYNPYRLLFGDPPVYALADAGTRRERLAELAVPPEAVLPAAVVVQPGYAGDPAGDPDPGERSVAALLDGLCDWAAGESLLGLHVLYTERATEAVAQAVRDRGGVSFPLATRWRLPVWWETWDGYLDGLPSKRRVEVRRERRRAAEHGVRPAVVDPERFFDQIIDGRCALLRRYGQLADRPAESRRLAALMAAYGSDLRVYGALRGPELLAATVTVLEGRTLVTVHAGAREVADPVPFAHFVANYYAIVDDAGSLGAAEIDYGLGQDGAKRMRGCRGAPLSGHVVPVVPAGVDLLVEAARLLAAGFSPGHQRWVGPGTP